MITDIEEGEKALRADPEATERLLARLGLGTSKTRRARTPIGKERIFALLEEAAGCAEDPPPSLQDRPPSQAW